MRVELVAVGTELLLGQIANTNAQWLSERLASIGAEVLRHDVVGDNADRIDAVLRESAGRADALIVTGGLGPTDDDITRDRIAAILGVPLVRVPEIERAMRERFAALGREMPESNLRQADVPEGTRWIEARMGTAPGLVATLGGCTIYALPGVPVEMRDMVEATVLPELRARIGAGAIVSRVIRSTGVAESRIGEMLADLFHASTNPTVAYLAGGGEVRVRLTAKAADEREAHALIAPIADEVVRRIGEAAFTSEGEELEAVVVRLLRERGMTLAAGESLTGGELGARITSVPGASDVFLGSAVCYAPSAKEAILGVSATTLAGPGAVSRECVAEMAAGARARFGADLGIALTGVAGPGPHEGIEAGTVWIGLAAPDRTHERLLRAPAERVAARRWATQHALDLVRRYLVGAELPEGPQPAR